MKKAALSSLFHAVSLGGALALLAGVLPGCGPFGYGSLSKSIQETIRSARSGHGTESGRVTGIDSPEFDLLLSSCVEEPLARVYGLELQGRLAAILGETLSEATRQATLAQAHRQALQYARLRVIRCLQDAGQNGVLSSFLRQWRDQFGGPGMAAAAPATPEQELAKALVSIATHEGTPRASSFLRIYYRRFVRAIDPFARLSDEAAQGGPLFLPREGEFARNAFARDGAVARIALRDLDSGESLEPVLAALEGEMSGENPPEALLLDLRSSGGVSPGNLERAHGPLRAAAEALPTIVWIDSGTRGTAELLAAALAPLPGTGVVGEASAGYAREFCESRVDASITLVHGCRDLRPALLPAGASIPVAADVRGPESGETALHLAELRLEGRRLPHVLSDVRPGSPAGREIQVLRRVFRELGYPSAGRMAETAEAWARALRGESQAPESPTDQADQTDQQ